MLFYETGFHYSLDYVFSKFIMCFCFTVLRFFFLDQCNYAVYFSFESQSYFRVCFGRILIAL